MQVFTIIPNVSETSWLFSLCSVPPVVSDHQVLCMLNLQMYNLMQKAIQMKCVFALNQQNCHQVTWQMKKKYYKLTQFCVYAGSIVVDPHWADLFMATGFNKALQIPWFALAEFIYAVRCRMKQFTEIHWQTKTLTVMSVTGI